MRKKGVPNKTITTINNILIEQYPLQVVRGGFNVPYLELLVTHKCTLKCKDCIAMMPYFTNQKNMDLDLMLQSIDKCFEYIDIVNYFHIIGGEPLLFPHLTQVLYKINKYRDRIRHLRIPTNGTIVPDEDVYEAMRKSRCTFSVTNYGNLSANIDILEEQCYKNGVGLYINDPSWVKPPRLPDDIIKNGESYYRCSTYCCKILEGKLFYCTYAANAHYLGIIPDDDANYVNLFDIKTTKDTIRSYIERSSPIPACSYCTGVDFNSVAINAAEQTNNR